MMRLLLDTQIFIWATMGSRRLSAEGRSLLMGADEVHVSAASIWEIAIKSRLGRIEMHASEMVQAIEASGFRSLSITPDHAIGVEQLALHHNDPFDRLLVAQAIAEHAHLVSADAILRRYTELVILV